GYTTMVRRRIERILRTVVGGAPTIDYTVSVSDMHLARVHLVVRPERGRLVGPVDQEALQQRVVDAIRSWDDEFARAVDETRGRAATTQVLREYGDAFPEAYKEDYGAGAAADDLGYLERLDPDDTDDLALKFTPVGGRASG